MSLKVDDRGKAKVVSLTGKMESGKLYKIFF